MATPGFLGNLMSKLPSARTLGLIGATAGGGYLAGRAAFRHSRNNPNMDAADKASYSAMWGLAGAGAGLAAGGIGMAVGSHDISIARNIFKIGSEAGVSNQAMLGMISKDATIGRMFRGASTAARRTYKAATWTPVRGGGIAEGFSAFKGHGKAIGLLAILAGGVGAMAYGYRKNPQSTDYANRDEMGGTSYDVQPGSIRERMGMLGATGDMVFGLNNARHG